MKVTEKELVKALEKDFPDHIIFAKQHNHDSHADKLCDLSACEDRRFVLCAVDGRQRLHAEGIVRVPP